MNIRYRYCVGLWARNPYSPSLGSGLPVEGVRHTAKVSMGHSSEISGKMEPYRGVTKERNGSKPEYQRRTDLGSWKRIFKESQKVRGILIHFCSLLVPSLGTFGASLVAQL